MERDPVDAGRLDRDLGAARLEHLPEGGQTETVAEDERQVTRARVVAGRGEAVRIDEVRRRRTDLARLHVHEVREILLRTGESLGHHARGVVGRVEKKRVEKTPQAETLPRLQVDLRRRGLGRELAHPDALVEPAALDGEDGCHDLRRARGRQRLRAVSIPDHFSTRRIHDDRSTRGQARAGGLCRRRGNDRDEQSPREPLCAGHRHPSPNACGNCVNAAAGIIHVCREMLKPDLGIPGSLRG